MIVLPSARGVLHSGAVGPTDPAFATVVQLAHFDGTHGSTTFTNSASLGNTITFASSDAISTTQSVYGGASFRRTTSTPPSSSSDDTDYQFGTNDFTIEFRYRPDSVATVNILDMRPNGVANAVCATLYTLSDGTLAYYVNGADRITSSSGVIQATTWKAIAVSRVSGTTRMFVDGNQVGSNYTDSFDYNNANTRIWMGSWASSAENAYYDELRISNGAFGSGAGRYSANYTPAAAAFPNS